MTVLKALFLASLYGTFMGLIAYGVSLLVGRLRVSRGAAMILWALVAVRLLCPVGITSAFSLFNVPQWAEQAAEQVGTRQEAQREEITPTEIQQPSQKPGTTANIENMTQEEVYQELGIVEPGYLSSVLPQTVEKGTAGNLGTVLLLVWLGGVACFVSWGIFSYVRFKRSLRLSGWLDLGLYEAVSVTTPCVVGFFHPRIYLPVGLTEQQRFHAVTHEKCHIRRGDHIWKLLSYGVLAVHWFNPLVWLFYHRFQQDMELACDEKALKILGEGEKAAYSQSLLDLSQKERSVTPGPVGFSENPTKNRILRALRYKRPLAVVTALVLVVGILLVGGVAAQPTEEEGLRLNEDGTVTVYLPTVKFPVDEGGNIDTYNSIQVLAYNQEGRPTQWDYYNTDKNLEKRGNRFFYDDRGNLTKICWMQGLDNYRTWKAYSYDENGFVVTEDEYGFDFNNMTEILGTQTQFTYDNDRLRSLISTIIIDIEDTDTVTEDEIQTEGDIDVNGDMTITWDLDLETQFGADFHYNEDGTGGYCWFTAQFMGYSAKIGYAEFECDVSGRIVQMNVFSATSDFSEADQSQSAENIEIDDEPAMQTWTVYDNQDRVIEERWYYDDETSLGDREIPAGKTLLSYDEYGNCVSALTYDAEGTYAYGYEWVVYPVNVTPEAALRLLHHRPIDPFEPDPTSNLAYSNPFGGTNP